MNKILLIGALATTALVGCSSQGDTPDVPGNGTDVHFLAMMTPHHQQAVDMSEIILAKSDVSPQTKDLAERIKVGQQEEIDYMTNLASQWGQGKAMEVHSTHIANGMITPDQLEKLKSLEGEGAEDTFLTLMHSHHEGAVAMTEDEVKNGSYQPLRDAAQKMIDVQTAEMREMEAMLAAG